MNYYHSNIYWHFTGSPKIADWSKFSCPDDIRKRGFKPKNKKDCFDIVDKILKSKTLLAKCNEKVSTNIKTREFCCVTDIPIQNLNEHTKYYGEFAIGFKHEKIHKQFNPVLYISKDRFQLKPVSLIKKPGGKLIMEVDTNEEAFGTYLFNHFKITKFSDKPGQTFYREKEWRKIQDFKFDYTDLGAIIVPTGYLSQTQALLNNLKIENVPILVWELLKKI